jgi:hypothetical protein
MTKEESEQGTSEAGNNRSSEQASHRTSECECTTAGNNRICSVAGYSSHPIRKFTVFGNPDWYTKWLGTIESVEGTNVQMETGKT